MTVYELIRELVNYDSNATVTFVVGSIETDDCEITSKKFGAFPEEVFITL